MFLRIVPFILLIGSAGFAQTKHPFTFEDMMALKRVAEPVVSPDGKWILYSAMDVNLEQNTRTSHLWLVSSMGGESRQVTSGTGEDRGRWSPDGKRVLFIAARDSATQVWISNFDSNSGSLTGEPTKATSLSTGADGALWSPTGNVILFLSEVYPDCKDDACNRTRNEEAAKSKVKAAIFTRLLYRHWNGYTGSKRSHLFAAPVSGGAAIDLTPGDHDVPPFNLGGQDLYAFSPDGNEVAYTTNLDEMAATSTNNEIFVVPVGGGTPKKISNSPGSDSTPLYSPDGKWIAWRMQTRPGYESDCFRLVIYDRQSGKINNLTESFDRWVGSFAWSPDSTTIFFSTEDKGQSPLYSLAAGGGEPKELSRGYFDSVTTSPDGKTIYMDCMSVQAPNEICSYQVGDASAKPLTHLNAAVLSQVDMSPAEPFWFTGASKTMVQGFLVKPPNFDSSKKYPLKLLIHGGPEGNWGDDWSFRWNAELFAANGYVVVMINPRGSTGYGQKFTDEINGDWGGRPFIDLMNGLDYVEKQFSFIDKSRECALGASYGGYMVNWILGHTNRFQCLVSHDGMFNTISSFGSAEELWFPTWEFKGTPWTNRASYDKWSPSNFATKFKTPTLVVHGQLDYRLDVSEAFQLFTALQLRKVPSKMLYFPDEGHWVLKPQNSRLWYKTVNDWVDSYLNPPQVK